MSDRGGCVTGTRGDGSRKFDGVQYNVWKVYVAEQTCGFSHERQAILTEKNRAQMQADRDRLKKDGFKTRLLRAECDQIYVLYILRDCD
jgi:hypothetical protein